MKQIKGGITVVPGFEAAAAAAQIKYEGRTDMALIYSSVPCVAAGTFYDKCGEGSSGKVGSEDCQTRRSGAGDNCQFGNCKCVYRRRRDAIL